MGQNNPQGSPSSGQHGHNPGQNPTDVDQNRGSVESGSHKPGGDGKKTAPERDERQHRPSKGEHPNSSQPGSRGPASGDRGGTS